MQPITETQIQLAHVTVGQGDADYYTPHWWPLHKGFWEESGGDDRLQKLEAFVDGPSLQGYLADKKTADAHGIDNLGQLTDPEVAKIFDIDGDGKADLYGCEPGWGCERVIEHHLTAYGLRDTVTHNQGGYFAIIPDAIERVRAGNPTPVLHLDSVLGERDPAARQQCVVVGGAPHRPSLRPVGSGHHGRGASATWASASIRSMSSRAPRSSMRTPPRNAGSSSSRCRSPTSTSRT